MPVVPPIVIVWLPGLGELVNINLKAHPGEAASLYAVIVSIAVPSRFNVIVWVAPDTVAPFAHTVICCPEVVVIVIVSF